MCSSCSLYASYLRWGCPDISGQASSGGNFESQLQDIDRELSKFDTPLTPQLDPSSVFDSVEPPLPSPHAPQAHFVPLDCVGTSTTSVQPSKVSTWTRLVRTTVDCLSPKVSAKIGSGKRSFVHEEDCPLLPCKHQQVLRSDEDIPTLLVEAVQQPRQNQ